jgi:hypothetical protein
MIALVSCTQPANEPEKELNADSTQVTGRIDSILIWPHCLDYTTETEVSLLDTNESCILQYTYYIENDSIILSQYQQERSFYFWPDEETFSVLELRLPLEYAKRGFTLGDDPEALFIAGGFLSSYMHIPFNNVTKTSITGSFRLSAFADSTITFYQNISVVAKTDDAFPDIYRYRGVETAQYWHGKEFEAPPIHSLRRRVIR